MIDRTSPVHLPTRERQAWGVHATYLRRAVPAIPWTARFCGLQRHEPGLETLEAIDLRNLTGNFPYGKSFSASETYVPSPLNETGYRRVFADSWRAPGSRPKRAFIGISRLSDGFFQTSISLGESVQKTANRY